MGFEISPIVFAPSSTHGRSRSSARHRTGRVDARGFGTVWRIPPWRDTRHCERWGRALWLRPARSLRGHARHTFVVDAPPFGA